ncbi:hypothetical protein FACS1894218_0180 [Bacilli bacterium]|nr:hypothetical protein FACS1894218_0180 [Bacilli bacterium]
MQNLVVVDLVPARDLILILGAIPGPEGSVVTIKTSQKMLGKKLEYTIIDKTIKEEILKQNENLENKEALHAANEAAEAEAKKAADAEETKKAAEAVARAKEKEAAEKAAKAAASAGGATVPKAPEKK